MSAKFLCVALCLCTTLDCALGTENVSVTSDERLLTRSITEFGLELYKKAVAETPGENIFFSPISISLALALTHLGAKGETLSQLNQAIKLNGVIEQQFQTLLSNVQRKLLETGNAYQLNIANRMFGEQSYNFLEQFVRDTQDIFGAELAKVDFMNNATEVTRIINTWVSDHTQGKILDLIAPGILDSLTRLVLVNAIYFKGSWLHEFNASLTEESDFHLSNNETARVNLMYNRNLKLGFAINSDLHFKAVELPFTENLGFFVLLPDEGASISDLEASLTVDVLNSLSFRENNVNIWLPRFTLKSEMDLKSLLKQLGVEKLFASGEADLSGIDGTRDLYVSQAIHKGFIEVNEEGAAAAVTTAVIVSTRSFPRIMNFKADRPFIFFIKEKTTESVLFFGKYTKV